MSKHVWIGDSRYMVTDAFDSTPGSKDMTDLAELDTFVRGRLAPLTPEQIAKQDAAMARARERNARLGLHPGSTEPESVS